MSAPTTAPHPAVPDVGTLLAAAVRAVGGTERPGQTLMAEAVDRAIRTGEHLAVQAGTGTGKSLAYLVPAIRHAVTRSTTVVVSTATIALQRQLVDRDLPRLAEALRPLLDSTPTFAILKGRRNYLCLHRLHSGPAEEGEDLFDAAAAPNSSTGRQVARLHEWASDTETGDRDELVPGVGDRAWRQVSVSARECLGVARCPVGMDCFAERARATAGKAEVVVTNHALLAIDAMGEHQVLPEHDLVIVDEAHDLVDRVTGAATEELTAAMVEAAARRCGRLVDQKIGDELAEAGDGLALLLAEAPVQRWDALGEGVAGALAAVRDAAHRCVSALGTDRREDPDAAAGRRVALAALEQVHSAASRLLGAFPDEEADRRDVVWLADETVRGLVLRVAPLTVAGLLRQRLFADRTVVLTSATLTLGGTFDALAGQWGLPAQRPSAQRPSAQRPSAQGPAAPHPTTQGPATQRSPATATERPPPADDEEPAWTGLDAGSPFEHRRAGILYTAAHLPPPGRDGLAPACLDELEALVTAAGGRTLGLFSSMRAARQAAETLRTRLQVPILCQGDDATGLLVRQFAESEPTCLFGTLSLWQGVDVPGRSLSLVVVDRIPFPRPDDPLASARQRAVAARGGNGFLAVAATHAALLLAQGTGRLLRTSADRGVVAVLDPRLSTARYSGFLRASLPPFWPTTDPQVVHAALRRLVSAPAG